MKYSGTKMINGIAVWRNNNWDKIDPNGLNLDWDDGKCVHKYNGILYAGGGMSSVNGNTDIKNFAMWDGQNWYPAGGGNPGGDVYDIIEYHDTIYLCGRFNAVSMSNPLIWLTTVASYYNDSLHNIVDGCYWAPGSTSSCFEIFNDELYIANNSGSNEGGVWKYKGGKCWEMVPDGPNGWIKGLVTDTFNTFMYAGGNFYVLGNENWKYLAMYDGYKWHKIGNEEGYAFRNGYEIYRGDLYMGCPNLDTFTNGLVVNGIARWDGTQWNALGAGTEIGTYPGNVYALEVYHDTLWVGGWFTYVDDTMRAHSLVKWFMPDTGCGYLKPIIYSLENNTLQDTFYLSSGQVAVQFYNNNPYVNTWDWDFDDGGIAGIKDPNHIYTNSGVYNVSVTVTHNGCTKTAERDIVIIEATDIDDLSLKDVTFKVYPNPTKQDFTVEISFPENIKGENKFFVTGMGGANKYRRHLQAGLNRFVVSTADWQPATYICNLMVGNKFVGSKKLVLTK